MNSTSNSAIGNPVAYTLSQAAKITGKDKSTLSKAIKKCRISATRREDGSYEIEAAELHRVYPPENGGQPMQLVGREENSAVATPIQPPELLSWGRSLRRHGSARS